MKIVVVGGSGVIGTRLCSSLCALGHEVFDASPVEGVDAVTGKGLDAMLQGAQVLVDVTDAPSLDSLAAQAFFDGAGRRLTSSALAAGVRHHLVLSVVGADRLVEGGYFRAKLAQEALLRASGLPYTIVRSTQFIHFLGRIADSAASEGAVRLPSASIQPVDADDLAEALAAFAVDLPMNRIVEVAGPESLPLNEAVRRYLAAAGDARRVDTDDAALYFGSPLMAHTLLPAEGARLGAITVDRWLAHKRDGFAAAAGKRHD